MHKKTNSIRGIMLIEFMMAMTISLLVVGCLTGMYVAVEQNDHAQEALNTIQDNARMAIQLLRNDIQLAGYIGCRRLTSDMIVKTNNTESITVANALIGFHGKKSDEITVRHAGTESAGLVQPMQNNSTLNVMSMPKFQIGEVAIISDCKSAEIFQIKHVAIRHAEQIIITMQPLSQQYNQTAEVSHLVVNTYFIKSTKRKTPLGSRINALYLKDNTRHITELVEGISTMQLQYDLRNDGNIITKEAQDIPDWSKVVGVNFNLTLDSLNAYPLQKKWIGYVALKEK